MANSVPLALSGRLNGFGDSSPISDQSLLKQARGHSDQSRQLSDSETLPLVFHPVIPACVVGLFSARRPTAVLRRIWAFVVDAVNGVMARWARSHILIECREVVPPSLTDANASPAIPLVVLGVSVVATRVHPAPAGIFRRFLHAMLVVDRCDLLSQQTPATTRPAQQAVDVDFSGRATFAHARPVVPARRWAIHRQSAELLAGIVPLADTHICILSQ